APGTTHRSCFRSVEALSRTIANESPGSSPAFALPVVIQMFVPFDAGLVHTLAPIDPRGTVQYVCSRAPVDWSYAFNPPRTSGRSHSDETPMYTRPPTTIGEAQS